MSRKWTLEEDNALIEMKAQGLTYDEISQRLGISYKSLTNRYFKIKNQKLKTYDPDLVEQIRNMTEKGMSLIDIGKSLGIHDWKVGEISRYYGMEKGENLYIMHRDLFAGKLMPSAGIARTLIRTNAHGLTPKILLFRIM